MKVLMLGWEFPPHISGGLGPAFQGLVRGLVHHAQEVTGIVPRTYGDEDTDGFELIGLSRATVAADPVPEGLLEAERGLGYRSGSIGPHGLGPHSSAYDRPGPLAGTEGSTAAEMESRWSERVATAVIATQAAAGRDFGAFHGGYGDSLLDEVDRYAHAVGAIATGRAFDVIHAHDWMTYPAGIMAARACGAPLVLHLHASEYDRSRDHPNPVVRGIEQMGFRAADRVVCVSNYTATILEQHYAVETSKLRVVHNAISARPDRPATNKPRRTQAPVVLFLGRVTSQKGPGYFLEAAARVLRVVPEAKFVISGSGDLFGPSVEQAATLGISRSVHFTGFLNREDVERMYAEADVYVMPSVSEPFGIAPLEAMAQRVPVIVSRQSGVSEVLQHALKVDFWDVDRLADLIVSLLRRPALRDVLARSGHDEVRRMRWEDRSRKLVEIYQEVMR